MSSIISDKIVIEPVAVRVWVEKKQIFVELYDDRIISFPARKFLRLSAASDDQLAEVRIRAEGSALRWDVLDEDLSIAGLVQGIFEAD